MSTDEHVPSDARMREQYIWAHAREAEGVAEQSYGIQVCSETWDAWLAAHDARVRRDAAREALTSMEGEHAEKAEKARVGGNPTMHSIELVVAEAARQHRDTRHAIPEETP